MQCLAAAAAAARMGREGEWDRLTWSISGSLPHVCIILGIELPLANRKPS